MSPVGKNCCCKSRSKTFLKTKCFTLVHVHCIFYSLVATLLILVWITAMIADDCSLIPTQTPRSQNSRLYVNVKNLLMLSDNCDTIRNIKTIQHFCFTECVFYINSRNRFLTTFKKKIHSFLYNICI